MLLNLFHISYIFGLQEPISEKLKSLCRNNNLTKCRVTPRILGNLSHTRESFCLNPLRGRSFIRCSVACLNKIDNKGSYMARRPVAVPVTKIIADHMQTLTCHDPLSLWVMSPLLEVGWDQPQTTGIVQVRRMSFDPDPITNTWTYLTLLLICCHLVLLHKKLGITIWRNGQSDDLICKSLVSYLLLQNLFWKDWLNVGHVVVFYARHSLVLGIFVMELSTTIRRLWKVYAVWSRPVIRLFCLILSLHLKSICRTINWIGVWTRNVCFILLKTAVVKSDKFSANLADYI